MDNLDYLREVKNAGSLFIEGDDFEYRKVEALEIIAEQIINLDNTLACLATIIRQRG